MPCKITISLCFLITCTCLSGQWVFPDLEGEPLKAALVASYKPVGPLDYSDARHKMFEEIDNRNDTVYCIYTNHGVWLDPQAEDPIQFLLMNNNPDGINTEHTFPQSQGAGTGNARADLHHLYPARVRVNESRGSFPFGEINDPDTEHWYYLNQDLTTIPAQMIDLYSEQRDGSFEPREARKGDIARAIFYFFTMYEGQANASFFTPMVETLCQWHVADPVDQTERIRNDAVANYQEGKANPFILDCTVANRTYCMEHAQCEPSGIAEVISTLPLELAPNPVHDMLEITLPSVSSAFRLIVTDLTGKQMHAQLAAGAEVVSLDVNHWPGGLYFVRMSFEDDARLYTGRFLKLW